MQIKVLLEFLHTISKVIIYIPAKQKIFDET